MRSIGAKQKSLKHFELISKIMSKKHLLVIGTDLQGAEGYHLYLLDKQEKCMYHYIGATSLGSSPLLSIPMHLESMLWGIEKGYKVYDFGGSSFYDSNIYKFKKDFGGDEFPVMVLKRWLFSV